VGEEFHAFVYLAYIYFSSSFLHFWSSACGMGGVERPFVCPFLGDVPCILV
jgi:hypothetical protein